jgi:peptide-methionine (S)-S-oxide reductase
MMTASNALRGITSVRITMSLRHVVVLLAASASLACSGVVTATDEKGSLAVSHVDPARTATLGGGCFWCLEAYFDRIEGIEAVTSGYAGGKSKNPRYDQVSAGSTGHAEVVQIQFDPARIRYDEILEIFFSMHDPTTLNRQGADEGTQYRSIVLYHSPEQLEATRRVIDEFTTKQVYSNQIVTEVTPYDAFYPAEISHQEYYDRNPDAGYCRVVIDPKIKKLLAKYSDRIKARYR